MRPMRLSPWLSVGATLLAGAGIAFCCVPPGMSARPLPAQAAAAVAPEAVRVKLPGDLARGVVRGDTVHVVTANGRLVTVNLRSHKVRDHGTLDAKLLPQLDVAGNRACVAAGSGKLLLVDLDSGKVTRTLNWPTLVAGLGFLGADRLYVQGAQSVAILDANNGKAIATIDQGKVKGRPLTSEGRPGLAHDMARQRLYVPIAGPKAGLGVFDLKSNKLVEIIPMPELGYAGIYGDVRLAGNRVHVLGLRYGYGVWTNHLGYVDLKERKYVRVTLPAQALQGASLIPDADGSLLLSAPNGCYRYGADGKFAGQTRANASAGRAAIIGLWNGRAVRGAGSMLEIAPLPPMTARVK